MHFDEKIPCVDGVSYSTHPKNALFRVPFKPICICSEKRAFSIQKKKKVFSSCFHSEMATSSTKYPKDVFSTTDDQFRILVGPENISSKAHLQYIPIQTAENVMNTNESEFVFTESEDSDPDDECEEVTVVYPDASIAPTDLPVGKPSVSFDF